MTNIDDNTGNDIDINALNKDLEEKIKKDVHPQALALRNMNDMIILIERGVGFHDKRKIARAVRGLSLIRKNATPTLLNEILKRNINDKHPMYSILKSTINEFSDKYMENDNDIKWLEEEIKYESILNRLKEKQRIEDELREKEENKKKTLTPDELAAEEKEKKRQREKMELMEKKRLEKELKKEEKDGKRRNKRAQKEDAKKLEKKAAQIVMEKEAKDIEQKKREIEAATKRKKYAEMLNVLKDKLVNMNIDNMLPEIEVYVTLLIIMVCVDNNITSVISCIEAIINRISLVTHNRRTLDSIAAQIYFYYSLVYERQNNLVSIRNKLLELHRTACLRHDEPSQCVLANSILRNYLHYNLYAHADKFRLNTKLPDSRTNSQSARYLYYLAKINAIQLHYGEAFVNVKQAVRKGPQIGGLGFQQAAHKLQVVIRLLMGDIPEREIFRQNGLQRSLKPYFMLTKAVRVGDLVAFKQVMSTYGNIFIKDRTYTLIIRLRHNVIKTGLRKISLSYSRISIKDICTKLHFDNEQDAEYVILKAINDGVIDAIIDKKGKFVYSKEVNDVYSTQEPQIAFHQRIEFCLDTYRDSIQALRFPPDYFSHKNTEEIDSYEL